MTFERNLDMEDVVVILPGILGSVLRKNGTDVWGLSVGAIARTLWHFGDNIKDLAIPENEMDLDDYDDGVSATRLLPDTHLVPYFWKVDGYSLVAKTLQNYLGLKTGQNYFEFPYDWRLDNRVAARRLRELSMRWLDAQKRAGAMKPRLILIAHSMGGLVSRYFLEVLGGWRVTRMLITFGTPFRGSVNALNFISNGLVKRVGPIKLLDLSEMIRSFPSVYQLLPTYACYDPTGNGNYLHLNEAASIPHLVPDMVAKAFAFHKEIQEAVEENSNDEEYKSRGYRTFPFVGTFQPTFQSAGWDGRAVKALQEFHGNDDGGDGTVPRGSATPLEMEDRRGTMFVAGRHASLQNLQSVLTHVQGLISDLDFKPERYRAIPYAIRVEIDDAFETGEPVQVRARAKNIIGNLSFIITNAQTGAEVAAGKLVRGSDQWHSVELPPLPEGTYRLTVRDENGKSDPVSDIFVVLRN
jgi:hypothetical protein